MILSIRSKNAVPFTTTIDILKHVEKFVQRIVDNISMDVISAFNSIKNLVDIPEKVNRIQTNLNTLKEVFTSMNTE